MVDIFEVEQISNLMLVFVLVSEVLLYLDKNDKERFNKDSEQI